MSIQNLFEKCQKIVGLVFVNIAALTVMSTASWAIVDAQLELGRRQGNWSQEDSSTKPSSDVMRAAVHFDPPLIPAAFGLAFYSETWHVNESDTGLSSLKSFSVVPEIVAWIPIDNFKPFARLGYSILSGYSGKAMINTGDSSTTGNIALAGVGLHAAVGVEWVVPLVPLLSILGEFEYANERVKLAKDEVAGINISGAYKPINLTSTAILVGAKVGF